MSEVYVHEPSTAGKVVMHTSMGPLDISLWPRETPRTCRNFVQLCLEGYYDNTVFHRLIPDFIIQGGDPTGTGAGGSSIYDDPEEDDAGAAGPPGGPSGALKHKEGPLTLELNSRLKFRYRGLLGATTFEAQGGHKKDHEGSSPAGARDSERAPAALRVGSQFFFTLGRADSLNGRYTLFGKVSGTSLFNLLRMGELPVDKNDRPKDPPRIIRTEVVWDPFGDIVPRVLPQQLQQQEEVKEEEEEQREKRPQLAAPKAALLSFAEEDEDLQLQQNEQQQPKSKALLSAHDLLEDPRLSKEAPPGTWQQQQEAAAQRLKARIALLAASSGKTAAAAAPEITDDSSSSRRSSRSRSHGRGRIRSRSRSRSRSHSRSRSRSRSRSKESHRAIRRPLPLPPTRKDIAAAAAALPDADLLTPAEQRRRLLLLQQRSQSTQRRQAETLEKLQAFRQQVRPNSKS